MTIYGLTGGEVLMQKVTDPDAAGGLVYAPSTAVFEVRTTRTGTTVVTGLQDLAGSALSGDHVTPDANGRVYFQTTGGEKKTLYLYDTAGVGSQTRWAVQPTDVGDRVDAIEILLASGLGYVKPAGGIPATDLDSATQALISGAIQKSIGTAAGDLITFSASGVPVRLAKGSALQQLRVNAAGTALEYFTLGLSLDALTDVTVASPTEGDFITRVGSQFVNRQIGPADIGAAPDDYIPEGVDSGGGPIGIINLASGAAVPAGTFAPSLIVYTGAVAGTWGFDADLGGAGAITNTATRTLDQAVVAGKTIVVGIAADAAGGTPATWTVSDSKGNSWSQVGTDQVQGSAVQTAKFRCRVSTSLAIGDTITVSCTETRQHLAFKVASFAGGANPALDKFTSGGAATTTALSVGPTAITTVVDEIVFAVFAYAGNANVFTPTGGYSLAGAVQDSAATTSRKTAALVYKVVSATGAQTASGSLSVATTYSAQIATFKKA